MGGLSQHWEFILHHIYLGDTVIYHDRRLFVSHLKLSVLLSSAVMLSSDSLAGLSLLILRSHHRAFDTSPSSGCLSLFRFPLFTNSCPMLPSKVSSGYTFPTHLSECPGSGGAATLLALSLVHWSSAGSDFVFHSRPTNTWSH